MIKFTDDKNQIIRLWQDVFGDSKEDIDFFLDNCHNKSCLGYFHENELVSMLFLIDCYYAGAKGKYIYAVCTDNRYRKKGFASSLINEAKSFMNDFLWLIPAKNYLFEYYAEFGFETKLYTSYEYEHIIKFDESSEITEYLYEGSSFDLPKGMMFSYLNFPCGCTGMKIKEN